MSEEFEFERDVDRDGAAALVRGIAEGVAVGAIRLEDGDRTVTAGVADEVEVSVEFEAEDDGELELELELEWDDPGPEATRAAQARGSSTDGDDRDPDGAASDRYGSPDDLAASGGDQVASEHDPAVSGRDPADPADSVADPAGADGDPGSGPGPEGEGGDGPVGSPATEGVGPAVPASLGRFELYTDRGGKWRWRMVHRNGNIIATSGQGYTRKHNAVKGLRSVQGNAPGAVVVEDEGD